MGNAVGRILKGKDVRLEGRIHLDVVQIGPTSTKEKGAAVEPAAHIVENQPEFSVVEINFSSGTKMYLRCEYAGAEAPSEKPTP